MGLFDGDSDNYLDDILSGLKMSEAHKRNIEKLKKRLRLPDDDAIFFYLAAVEYTVKLCEDVMAEIKLERLEIERLAQDIQSANQAQAETINEHLNLTAQQVIAGIILAGQEIINDIKQTGQAATSAIAQANDETLTMARQTVNEATELAATVGQYRNTVETDRATHSQTSQLVLGLIESATTRLTNAANRFLALGMAMDKLQSKIRLSTAIGSLAPLTTLGVAMAVGGVIWAVIMHL